MKDLTIENIKEFMLENNKHIDAMEGNPDGIMDNKFKSYWLCMESAFGVLNIFAKEEKIFKNLIDITKLFMEKMLKEYSDVFSEIHFSLMTYAMFRGAFIIAGYKIPTSNAIDKISFILKKGGIHGSVVAIDFFKKEEAKYKEQKPYRYIDSGTLDIFEFECDNFFQEELSKAENTQYKKPPSAKFLKILFNAGYLPSPYFIDDTIFYKGSSGCIHEAEKLPKEPKHQVSKT